MGTIIEERRARAEENYQKRRHEIEEVVRLKKEGLTISEIAARLGIKESVVICRLMQK